MSTDNAVEGFKLLLAATQMGHVDIGREQDNDEALWRERNRTARRLVRSGLLVSVGESRWRATPAGHEIIEKLGAP